LKLRNETSQFVVKKRFESRDFVSRNDCRNT
jgi:hypothetical protein